MRKIKNCPLWFIGGLILISGAFLGFWNPASQGQSKTSDQPKNEQPLGKLPIADFQTMKVDSDSGSDETQKRFNAPGRREIQETEEGSEITYGDSWIESLSTIPVDRSDLIVRCTIVGAQARISKDRTTVYSEFVVTPTQIIRGQIDKSAVLGSTLSVFRLGGAVRFSSRPIQTYSLLGAGALEVGGDYVVFLKWDSSIRVYNLLTASKVENSKMYPIDLTRDRKMFIGSTFSDFLDKINTVSSDVRHEEGK